MYKIEKLVNETIIKSINNKDLNIEEMIKDLTEDEKTLFYLSLKRRVAFIQMQENQEKMSNMCHECINKKKLPGSLQIACECLTAQVFGDEHGIKEGYFDWPVSFDPFWLDYCDSFVEKY